MKKHSLFLAYMAALVMAALFSISSCKEDPCETQYCLNGDCLEGECICPPGFTGEHCEEEIASGPKYNCVNGNCQTSANGTFASLSECELECTPPQKGQVVFWEKPASGCTGTTSVTIGSTTKQITNSAASAPACGASGFATFQLSPGTHNYSASRLGKTVTGTVTVTADQCTKTELLMRQTVTFTPADVKELRLDHINGNKEFNGDGPNVTVTATYYWDSNPATDKVEIWLRVFMRAKETNTDWTEGTVQKDIKVYTCPAGMTVGSILTKSSFTHGPLEDLSTAMNSYSYSTNPSQSMISKLEYKGDTGGDDLATGGDIETEGHLHLMKFNPVSVCLVRR